MEVNLRRSYYSKNIVENSSRCSTYYLLFYSYLTIEELCVRSDALLLSSQDSSVLITTRTAAFFNESRESQAQLPFINELLDILGAIIDRE